MHNAGAVHSISPLNGRCITPIGGTVRLLEIWGVDPLVPTLLELGGAECVPHSPCACHSVILVMLYGVLV
jgi:hypothetical protein